MLHRGIEEYPIESDFIQVYGGEVEYLV